MITKTVSCFACKLKGNKCGGICVVRDGMHPILEKAAIADAIILGSPVYYGDMTAEALAFTHRFLFAAMRYEFDSSTGKPVLQLPGTRKCALIMTMNASEDLIKSGYGKHFEPVADSIRFVFGNCELLFSCDTYQFSDYSKYYASAFNAEAKALHREEQFPVDLQNAYKLGARLAQGNSHEIPIESMRIKAYTKLECRALYTQYAILC